jgi:hypothetical protein
VAHCKDQVSQHVVCISATAVTCGLNPVLGSEERNTLSDANTRERHKILLHTNILISSKRNIELTLCVFSIHNDDLFNDTNKADAFVILSLQRVEFGAMTQVLFSCERVYRHFAQLLYQLDRVIFDNCIHAHKSTVDIR